MSVAQATDIQAGRVFEHKDFRWSNGEPRRCVVLAVSNGRVAWTVLADTGRPLRQTTR